MAPFILFKEDTIAEIHAYVTDTRRYREIYKGQVFRLMEKSEDLGCILLTFKRLDNDVMIYNLTVEANQEQTWVEIESSESARILYGQV